MLSCSKGAVNILKDAKQIKDFPEYYILSNGDIYSFKNKPRVKKGWRKLTPFKNRGGYSYIYLVDGDKKKRCAIHRLVAEYYCAGYFDGAVVNHIDGDKDNNDYRNLEWITQRENVVKGYGTSGLDQKRNFRLYKIKFPDGTLSEEFSSGKEVKEFILNNSIDVSPSSLLVHGRSRGYELIKYK